MCERERERKRERIKSFIYEGDRYACMLFRHPALAQTRDYSRSNYTETDRQRQKEKERKRDRDAERQRQTERHTESENSKLYYSRNEILGSSLFLQSILAKLQRQHL